MQPQKNKKMLKRHICLSWVSDFLIYMKFLCKFHSNWGQVIGKIKQNEPDRRDTAPLNEYFKKQTVKNSVW